MRLHYNFNNSINKNSLANTNISILLLYPNTFNIVIADEKKDRLSSNILHSIITNYHYLKLMIVMNIIVIIVVVTYSIMQLPNLMFAKLFLKVIVNN